MATITSAQPYFFGESYRDTQVLLAGVKLNGGTVVTEQLVNGAWVNTGDTYTDGTYQLTAGGGGVRLRIVCTGSAAVEVP